jgi:hypothetical protein
LIEKPLAGYCEPGTEGTVAGYCEPGTDRVVAGFCEPDGNSTHCLERDHDGGRPRIPGRVYSPIVGGCFHGLLISISCLASACLMRAWPARSSLDAYSRGSTGRTHVQYRLFRERQSLLDEKGEMSLNVIGVLHRPGPNTRSAAEFAIAIHPTHRDQPRRPRPRFTLGSVTRFPLKACDPERQPP